MGIFIDSLAVPAMLQERLDFPTRAQRALKIQEFQSVEGWQGGAFEVDTAGVGMPGGTPPAGSPSPGFGPISYRQDSCGFGASDTISVQFAFRVDKLVNTPLLSGFPTLQLLDVGSFCGLRLGRVPFDASDPQDSLTYDIGFTTRGVSGQISQFSYGKLRMLADEWYYVSARFVIGAVGVGSVAIRIYDISETLLLEQTDSGIDTIGVSSGGSAQFVNFLLIPGISLDDVIIKTGGDAALDNPKVLFGLRPNAAGAANDWVPNNPSAPANLAVDDLNSLDDNWLTSTAADETELYVPETPSDYISAASLIDGLQTSLAGISDQGFAVNLLYRNSDTSESLAGSPSALQAGGDAVSLFRQLDSAGAAWTRAKVLDSQFGYRRQ